MIQARRCQQERAAIGVESDIDLQRDVTVLPGDVAHTRGGIGLSHIL